MKSPRYNYILLSLMSNVFLVINIYLNEITSNFERLSFNFNVNVVKWNEVQAKEILLNAILHFEFIPKSLVKIKGNFLWGTCTAYYLN